MTDGTDDGEQPKRTMRERLEAHGIKVRESSNGSRDSAQVRHRFHAGRHRGATLAALA
jgi:hypothetical protein